MRTHGCPSASRRLVVGTTVAMAAVLALSLATRLVSGTIEVPSLPVDVAVGVGSCALVPLLLRRPVPIAYVMVALATVAPLATPAATLAVLVTAMRRPLRTAMTVAAVGVIAHAVQGLLVSGNGLPYGWWLILDVAVHAALVGIGAMLQARAALIESLLERARRAEQEQGRRVAEARRAERTRIAREMHDVLGHRLSLVATYAGALEYRSDVGEEQRQQAVAVIRSGVRQALDELRVAIGVLRDDADDHDGSRPQPGVRDLPRLIEESRSVGTDVVVHGSPAELEHLPAGGGRAAYRLVQEGLTNARKHAPGQDVTVTFATEPGGAVVIELRNGAPAVNGETGEVAEPTGTGTGLLGLTERVRLAGGELDHGFANGEFFLRAELPTNA